MGPVFIVVADHTCARFYAQAARGAPLRLIEELLHPEGGFRNKDLVTDRGGRPNGRPDSYQPHTSPKEHEQDLLAQRIGQYLERARQSGAFAELLLVMGPQMLGRVKKQLDAQTMKVVAMTIESDVTHLNEHELTAWLRDKWFVPAAREPMPSPKVRTGLPG